MGGLKIDFFSSKVEKLEKKNINKHSINNKKL